MRKTTVNLKIVLSLAVVAALFQNCAAAGPPDLSQVGQASTGSQLPTPTPVPGSPPIVVQPTPVPTATPVATPAPTPVATPSNPYACKATLSSASEFFPLGFCSYTCVGANSTFHAFANDPSKCSPSPIGVAGTESMYTQDFSQTVVRPFSQCTITRNFSFDSSGYFSGDSYCN